jgi:hypothetical protein
MVRGMERPELPDGHEWTGRQTEIRLLDPTDCPGGHRFEFGQRCGEPQSWRCACGRRIVRRGGEYVEG